MICNDSVDVRVYVYIIIYNLVYRKGKNALLVPSPNYKLE